jgi:hypothetical protein
MGRRCPPLNGFGGHARPLGASRGRHGDCLLAGCPLAGVPPTVKVYA